MEQEKGIVYILTNPMFKEDVIKIGNTQNIEKRVKQLSRETGVPCPFECYVAYEVNQYKKIEKIMHSIYRGVEKHTDKEHSQKEFFQVLPSKADDVLSKIVELLEGRKVNIDSDKVYTSEEKAILEKENLALQKKERAKNFKFNEYHIPVGSKLTFIKDDTVHCQVLENNKVLYQNKEYSLSRLTINLMKELGYTGKHYNGYAYWLYDNMLLNDMIKEEK